jgi:hypothetical protein
VTLTVTTRGVTNEVTILVYGIRAVELAYNIINRRESRQVETITREFRLNRVSRNEFFITLLD